MIQTMITHSCPKCGSDKQVRNGHDYRGAQECYCHACQSYGTLQAQRGYDERTPSQVKRAVLERISLRRVERLFGLLRRTVAAWIADWAAQLPPHPADCRLFHR